MNNDFRKYKPEAIGKIDFRLPTIETAGFGNVSIYHAKKNNLPICQLEVIIECGSKEDPDAQEGLTHLAAMMIDEGAGEYSSLQLSEEFEKLGTIFSISSDKDIIHLSILSLEEYIERSVELLSLVLLKPRLESDDFNREKQKLLAKILQSKDNPSNIASTLFDKIVYDGSGYSTPVIGKSDSVESISLAEIQSFHKNVLLNKKWSVISIGSIPVLEITKMLERYLKDNAENSLAEPELFSTVNDIENSFIYVVDHEGAAQTEIMIGHGGTKRNSGEYYAKHLLNSILGGQFTSRINLNLREDKGYTYGAGSSFNYNKEAGAFYVTTSVQSEVTGNAVKEILYELKKIKEGVTEEELDFAKSSLVKRFPSQFETYSQVANNISNLVIHNLELEYYNDYIRNISGCSIDEVNRAGMNHIHDSKLAILCVGNSTIIKEQLTALFDYEIIDLDKEGNKI